MSAEVSTPLDSSSSSSVSKSVIVKLNSGCAEPLCISRYFSRLLCSQLETQLHLDIRTLTLSGESKELPLIAFTAARAHVKLSSSASNTEIPPRNQTGQFTLPVFGLDRWEPTSDNVWEECI